MVGEPPAEGAELFGESLALIYCLASLALVVLFALLMLFALLTIFPFPIPKTGDINFGDFNLGD